MVSTSRMNEDALIRLENLRRLNQSAKELEATVGGRYTYWRDMLAGTKSFGEKAARKIEEKYGLVRGQLDQVNGVSGANITAPSPMLSSSASNHPQPHTEKAPVTTNGIAPFGQTLQGLAHHLANVDASKREAAIGVMTALMRNPDDLALLSALTTLLVPAAFVYQERKAA